MSKCSPLLSALLVSRNSRQGHVPTQMIAVLAEYTKIISKPCLHSRAKTLLRVASQILSVVIVHRMVAALRVAKMGQFEILRVKSRACLRSTSLS